MNNSLSIIMYHNVKEVKKPQFPKLNVLEFSEFKNQLDYLQKNYNILGFEDFLYCTKNKKKLPENACMLTFDDGYKDHIQYVLPELIKRKIKGLFFPSGKAVLENIIMDVDYIHLILACVSDNQRLIKKLNLLCEASGFTEKEIKMNWKKYAIPTRFDSKEVRYAKGVLQNMFPINMRYKILHNLFKYFVKLEPKSVSKNLYLSLGDLKELLTNKMYIGGHGYNHLWMKKENKDIQKKEIDLTLKFLKKIRAQTKNWVMCYPFGSYNLDTISLLKENDSMAALTIKLGVNKLSLKNLFELKRFDTNDFPK